MSIIFDKSDRYISLFCTECTAWHAFAWDRDDAEKRAGDHEERCHPGVREVRRREASRDTTRRYKERMRPR